MLRLRDIQRLSPHEFRYDNSIRANFATPCYRDTASGLIVVERPWELVGWCDGKEIDSRLMIGREGQVCLMLWHPAHGSYWEHYPLYDDEERACAEFERKAGE